jgi:hypothetical protein
MGERGVRGGKRGRRGGERRAVGWLKDGRLLGKLRCWAGQAFGCNHQLWKGLAGRPAAAGRVAAPHGSSPGSKLARGPSAHLGLLQDDHLGSQLLGLGLGVPPRLRLSVALRSGAPGGGEQTGYDAAGQAPQSRSAMALHPSAPGTQCTCAQAVPRKGPRPARAHAPLPAGLRRPPRRAPRAPRPPPQRPRCGGGIAPGLVAPAHGPRSRGTFNEGDNKAGAWQTAAAAGTRRAAAPKASVLCSLANARSPAPVAPAAPPTALPPAPAPARAAGWRGPRPPRPPPPRARRPRSRCHASAAAARCARRAVPAPLRAARSPGTRGT